MFGVQICILRSEPEQLSIPRSIVRSAHLPRLGFVRSIDPLGQWGACCTLSLASLSRRRSLSVRDAYNRYQSGGGFDIVSRTFPSNQYPSPSVCRRSTPFISSLLSLLTSLFENFINAWTACTHITPICLFIVYPIHTTPPITTSRRIIPPMAVSLPSLSTVVAYPASSSSLPFYDRSNGSFTLPPLQDGFERRGSIMLDSYTSNNARRVSRIQPEC